MIRLLRSERQETTVRIMSRSSKVLRTMGGFALLAGACVLYRPAMAQTCEATIEGNDAIRFNLSQINIPERCQQFTVHLKHVGKLPKMAMGHNWVLTRKQDLPGVIKDAMAAGAAKDYLDPTDPRILAYTAAIGGGQQTSVTFPTDRLKPGEEYVFFCSYGAHHVLMQGLLQVVR